jgi:hypothetical protein
MHDSLMTLRCVMPMQYLPGIIATLALIMINCIRQDDLMEIDPFDDTTYCRCRNCLDTSQPHAFNPGWITPPIAGAFITSSPALHARLHAGWACLVH